MSSKPVLELQNIVKIYNRGKENELSVLKNINFSVGRGEFVSIMGPSGSGKTTLLDIAGCLMKPTEGRVFVDGTEINGLSDEEIAKIRGEKLGFVFQQYNLIPSYTALENVALSLRINGKNKRDAETRAEKLLGLVGLEQRLNHKPSQLSGGEQQRVAIARALANDPSILLADEPTGNLDTKTGEKIIRLLEELNRKGYTIVIITHDQRIARFAKKIIRLKDGKIVSG